MASLNYSWQELGRVTFYASGNDTVSIEGRITSQSTANNTTTLQLRWVNVGAWWRTTSGTVSFTGTFDDSGSCATYPDKINNGDVFFQIEKTVSHDSDGNLTIYVGGTISAYINSGNRSGTISNVSVSLPKIDRYAIITGTNDFNDEQNPYMTFSNPGGFRINVRLEFGGTSIRRDNISNTGSYTFSLTNTERNTLRQKCTGKTMIVRYVIATCFSGTTESGTNYQDKTMTIVNANPTATYTVAEQDAKVIELLGSSSTTKIISNASDLLFTITPTALKYATISSVYVNGSQATKSGNNYLITLNNVSTNTFSIVVNDSRTNTTTYTLTKTLLSYVAVNIHSNWSIVRTSQTSSDLKLNAIIDCYSSTIDGNTNTPIVQYSMDNTNWITISSSSYTFNDNKITITNYVMNNLISYQDAGTFYLKVSDLLTTHQDNKQVSVGIYTLAKSDRKVRINGTLEIADANGQNRKEIRDLIYPIGSIYLTIINVNPSTLFGGTWEKIYGGYLYGAGQTIDKTTYEGWGTQSHTLTTDEIPSHNHDSYGWAEVSDGSGSYKVFGVVSGASASGVGTRYSGGGQGHTHNIATIDVFVWKRIA